MATRKKKTGLLKYGYWNYPDPAPAIRKLLAKKEELLDEFEEMYGDAVPYEGFAEWAQGEGVPARVSDLIETAEPGGGAELFDEVEIASGSGPDMGGMIDWQPTIYARRQDGVIAYRLQEEMGSEPDDSKKPLDDQTVFDLLNGDGDWDVDEILGAWAGTDPTLEQALAAIDKWADSGGYSSEFHDLESLWNDQVEGLKEQVRDRFATDRAE
jgi:hypothetical protein